MAVGPGRGQFRVQIQPRGARPQGHVQRIRARVAPDQRAVERHVEGAEPHSLHGSVMGGAVVPAQNFRRGQEKGLLVKARREDLFHDGQRGPTLAHHQGAGKVCGRRIGYPAGDAHGQRQSQVARHDQHGAIGPERGVERRELPLVRGDRLDRQVLAQQVLVAGDRIRERRQHHTLRRQFGQEVGVHHPTVDLDDVPGGVPVLAHGPAQLGRPVVVGDRVSGGGGTQGVEVEGARQVGIAPLLEPGRGERRPLVGLPGSPAAFGQPVRLAGRQPLDGRRVDGRRHSFQRPRGGSL